ncbi:hypothetical protein C7N43_37735 [Sphingobacteriales bacterium UPWRP_1]|nr:hypothetical protein C7N43_37735 [Sphingobacteriales bacterium UPWRP_1]
MFDNKNLVYSLSALSAAVKIGFYTQRFETAEDFWMANNQMNFNATTALLIAIAEDTKKLDIEVKLNYAAIPWQNIADMRNILAHDYRGIDPDIVFDVVQNYLPRLQDALVEIVKSINNLNLNLYLSNQHYQHIRYLFM